MLNLLNSIGTTPNNNKTSNTIIDYHVIIAAGQSNMCGQNGDYDAGLDAPDPDIYQLKRAGDGTDMSIIQAAEQIDHWDQYAASNGMVLTYAKAVLATLPANSKILIVPTAKGGSGFFSSGWAQDGYLWNDYILRSNTAMGLGNNALHSIIWHQGEHDNGQTKAFYDQNISNFVARSREEITGANSTTPFICGDLRDTLTLGGARQSLAAIESLLPYSAFIASTRLTDTGDGVHFTGASLRTFGTRYFDGLSSLSGDLSITAPSAITDLAASPIAAAADLTWTAPSTGGSAIVNYIIEYKLASDSTWTEFDSGLDLTTSIRVTGLTNDSLYDFRVTAVTAGGVGATSNIPQATPVAPNVGPITNFDTDYVLDWSAQLSASYGGTGQTVTNIAAGSSEPDAWLGLTSAVEASDPVFGGTAGTYDGSFDLTSGDCIKLKSSTALTSNLHRSDSTQDWTISGHFYHDGTRDRVIFGTGNIFGSAGIVGLTVNSNHSLRIYSCDNTGAYSKTWFTSTSLFTAGANNTFSFSYNAITRSWSLKINGQALETGTVSAFTETSPTTNPLTFGTDSGGSYGLNTGSKLLNFALANTTKTEAEMEDVHNQFTTRTTA